MHSSYTYYEIQIAKNLDEKEDLMENWNALNGRNDTLLLCSNSKQIETINFRNIRQIKMK